VKLLDILYHGPWWWWRHSRQSDRRKPKEERVLWLSDAIERAVRRGGTVFVATHRPEKWWMWAADRGFVGEFYDGGVTIRERGQEEGTTVDN
jgi:hypothetical protein